MRRLLFLLVLAGCAPGSTPPAPGPSRDNPPPKSEAPPPPRESGNLAVEPIDLSEPGKKQNHSVIVFAAKSDGARLALLAHRSHNEKTIAELPATKAGDAGLYLVWGDMRGLDAKPKLPVATYDAKRNRILIRATPWEVVKEPGIGMDWGVNRKATWEFIGFRVSLEGFPAGPVEFEVVESDGDPARVLSKGSISLAR
jgi:hypothetical protein